jgi:site-specific recombinase XerC
MGKAAPCRHPDVVRLLVTGQVIAMNPASSVRGPRYSTKKGKTPVLAADEARTLLDSIDTNTHIGPA